MTEQRESDTQLMEEEVRWTDEQQAVIDARDKSLLVSAAAGSGKTAVLVQRILSMVTDPEHPIDVDELLIVTFTNAAAAQMRERILEALTEEAAKYPKDTHLQRQMALVHSAMITTIDSFCLSVVKNHFHRIGLEPGFRIADAGELKLMKEDVCDAVLESFYEERDPDFLRFVEGYSGVKDDDKIRKKILSLFEYAESFPWPGEWLDACAGEYDVESVEDLESRGWVREYLDYNHLRVQKYCEQYRYMIAATQEADGPSYYEDTFRDDLRQLEPLTGCESLQDWYDALKNIDFGSLSRKPGNNEDKEKRKALKETRDKIKLKITELREKDFSREPAGQLEILKKTGEMARVLVRLTKNFRERFAGAKAEKNIVDFPDVEHFALQILVDPETKELTETAGEYRGKFKEVMIDEYQDSNYLQEEILTAVSGLPVGAENRFMVGDIKQSIYRFRLARPEIFLDKYETFSREDNPTQRIDLHKNFRSRAQIINFVNDLFGRIMGSDLGNVEYDEDAALYQGKRYEEDGGDYRTECIQVDIEEKDKKGRGRSEYSDDDDADEDNDDSEDSYAVDDKILAEAGVIARRIRSMIEGQELPGKQYRDVVILLRAMKGGLPEAFVTAFEQEGVPLIVASKTGYFSAQEVKVVMAMLRVIDNPRQDIPLATVMRSPIGNFSDEEMTVIKAVDLHLPFFECAVRIAGHDDEPEDDGAVHGAQGLYDAVREKTVRFWEMIDSFRARVPYTPIHTLIQQIYDETGYRDLVTALPAGEQRRANLDMLLEKAVAYEKTSYHGVFHFVRYIDQLIKYDVDIGEAETASEQENAVRLMTVHNSKGLEFPVVFLACMGREFNMTDVNSDIILHPRYGLALKWYDAGKRVKSDTIIRRAFSVDQKKESLGEELRVLYVALTRAKEKLVLTWSAGKDTGMTPNQLEAYEKLDFVTRIDAQCYRDWVVPAISSCPGICPVETVDGTAHEAEDAAHAVRMAQRREELARRLETVDAQELEEIDRRFSWTYPFRQSSVKQKMSVSEIKHRAMAEAREIGDEEEAQELFPDETPVPYIPKFVKEPEENEGALRGTAFHRLMECLDFEHIPDFSDEGDAGTWLEGEIERICSDGLMEQEEAERINQRQAARFLESKLVKRMRRAAGKGLLVREQPFVMSVAADRLQADADETDSVLVQGIIDAFWEEEDGIVLLDYKTDRVDEPGELIRRYQAQLQLYSEALTRRFRGRSVKEILIYSVRLDELIPVEPGE